MSGEKYRRYDSAIYQRDARDSQIVATAKNIHVAQRIVDALNQAEKRQP